MNLLLSNDDGISAPGLLALEEALADLGTVWVVAPDGERSAQSHALTMHEPLRARPQGTRRWAVSGTPADSVYLGLYHLVTVPIDIVVSGINRGANLGSDVFYSGTVAAAMEGALQGVPAVAASLGGIHDDVHHWQTAASFARRVVEKVLTDGLPSRVLLNLNVPNRPLDEVRGLKTAVQGDRRYHPLVEHRLDPRGGDYYWLGGTHAGFQPIDGSDGPFMDEGWATVTPMVPDLTHHATLDTLRAWTDQNRGSDAD